MRSRAEHNELVPRDQRHARPQARRPSEGQRIGAELLGTALLTFVAAGADIVEFVTGGAIGHAARYVAPALVVTAMIWSLSGISGAHINPAVTLAFVARRSFPGRRIVPYLAAQFAGAAVAALALRAIFGAAVEHGITKPAGFAPWQAFAIETILTFILVFTILATSEEKAVVGKNGALAVATGSSRFTTCCRPACAGRSTTDSCRKRSPTTAIRSTSSS